MEKRMKEISARSDPRIRAMVANGHFATNHSHVNYYIDMTSIRTNYKMAKAAAGVFAQSYAATTKVDTIICLDETEVVGAFLAEELAADTPVSVNCKSDICVVTPELNRNNQMIFRNNTHNLVWDKDILLLITSVTTGKTLNRLKECLDYYNGHLVGIAALFSAAEVHHGMPVHAIFTAGDVPGYETCLPGDCALCVKGQKLDAIVNSFGYAKL